MLKTALSGACRRRDSAAWLLLTAAGAVLPIAMIWEPRFQWTAEIGALCFSGVLWATQLLLCRWTGYDPWLVPLAGAANVFGLLLAFRLDPQAFYRLVIYSVLGLLLLLTTVAIARCYPGWPAWYRWSAFTAMGLLLLTALAGRQVNGAKSWLFIGGLGLEPSQPAMAFFALTVGMALGRDVRDLWMAGVAAVLLAGTHNLGSVLVLVLVLTGTAWLRGWPWRGFAVAAACFLVLGAVFYLVFPVVPARIALWLAPTRGPDSFQMIRAFHGFARGGLWGTGLARSAPQDIPAAGSDFVLAAWAEIGGVWATWIILGLYLLYLYRGLRAGAGVFPDAAPAARALALLIVCQAFLLAGGNTGLLPVTGVAMPFLSCGGSTSVGSYLATGMLLSLGPPGEPGRRERVVLAVACVAAGILALGALWRSMGM